MRASRLATRPPPALPRDGAGQDHRGLALLLGAVGLCAVIGIAAGWTLLFGPPTVPWPAIAVLAVLAVAACTGAVATFRARRTHDLPSPLSTSTGLGNRRDRDDSSEWS